MEIEVPDQHRRPFLSLLRLDPAERRKLLDIVDSFEPQFSFAEIIDKVKQKSDLADEEVGWHLAILSSLSRTFDTSEDDLPSFIDAVVVNAKALLKESGEEDNLDWELIKTDLSRAIDPDACIGMTTKTEDLSAEYEKIFNSIRICTDPRPIFYQNRSAAPSSFMIIHNLKIAYETEDSTDNAIYMAVQSSELREIESEIKKALQKEETLVKSLEQAGFRIIN